MNVVSNLAGRTIGPYVVARYVGSGGMAEVWEADDPELDRKVALKILRSPENKRGERFIREGNLQAKLDHRSILDVYGAGNEGRMRYIAMRLVRGRSLNEMGPIDSTEAIGILRSVAEALDYAHSKKMLHRDVKTGNIMVEDTDAGRRVFLCDFGLALLEEGMTRFTAVGQFAGTKAYVAPEICRGGDPTKASDIYALGCVAFTILAGKHPFEGESESGTFDLILKDERPRFSNFASGADGLDKVFFRVLASDPEKRPGSAGQFLSELSDAVDGTELPTSTRRLPPDPAPSWDPDADTEDPGWSTVADRPLDHRLT